MRFTTDGASARRHGDRDDEVEVRVAAAGDIHCDQSRRAAIEAALADADRDVDLILLAGDLTTHGDPVQARLLADACRELSTPVVAVLGNHDWHAGRTEEIVEVLRDAGVVVLDRSHTTLDLRGIRVGVAGTKGFVGGFPGSHLPDFGEPALRAVYAETSGEVHALDEGLRAIELCSLRIVLMHYSPTLETLRGERPEISAFLGTDRLAAPISEHGPDVVLHGHAHSGSLRGRIAEVPVFNVSVPVIGAELWRFALTAQRHPHEPIH